MNDCIILTGGGTAGHVMVNINLQDELKKHFKKIIYFGSSNGIEKELVQKLTTYKYQEIPTVKLDRSKIYKLPVIPFKLIGATKKVKELLKFYNPSVVFSKGGYVGLPVVMASKKLKIPCICHESDLSLGLANKLAKIYADKICTSFKKTAEDNGKKCVHTSMPIKISTLTKSSAKAKLNINTSLPVLLVTGGSLGAKALNEFIFENIDSICSKYYILHLVGKGNANKEVAKKQNYQQIEFSNDMWTIFKATDFAISRAGANTIIELLANNILTVFVPLPKSVSRGDQIENAKYLENQGVSKTIMQENLSLNSLFETLKDLKNNSKQIKSAIKNLNFSDGTQNIMSVILNQAKH